MVYAQELHRLLVDYSICSGNMEKGEFRCDANVSVRPAWERRSAPGVRSRTSTHFRFMEHAIEFEAKRQIEILEDGGKIVQGDEALRSRQE